MYKSEYYFSTNQALGLSCSHLHTTFDLFAKYLI